MKHEAPRSRHRWLDTPVQQRLLGEPAKCIALQAIDEANYDRIAQQAVKEAWRLPEAAVGEAWREPGLIVQH
eukprot:9273897-Alexandrium_andersonii.AAC.1